MTSGSEARNGSPPGESAPAPDAVGRLRRRDEMLQVLFWLEGEGFASDMTPAGIRRFLDRPEAELAAGLEDLVAAGFAARAEDEAGAAEPRYELTREGRQEGGRRFLEEFAPLLSRDTHHGSECQDPECECHTSPLGAAACTGHQHEVEP